MGNMAKGKRFKTPGTITFWGGEIIWAWIYAAHFSMAFPCMAPIALQITGLVLSQS